MNAGERRARFRELHEREQLFVMPNPWDAGSARILAAAGFEALATTSAGFAWSLGKLDQQVTRDELVAHVADLSAATDLPLNVDSERCYPDDQGGVAETVRLLAEAGAAGCSIEDYDPATGAIDDVGLAAERVAAAAEIAHSLDEPMVLTGRAENHIHGVDDLEDTIARLIAYRDAGADCVYAPGLTAAGQIAAVVDALGVPVNVLALPAAPSDRGARDRRRAARLYRRLAGRRRVRCASRRRTGAARHGHVRLRRGLHPARRAARRPRLELASAPSRRSASSP